MTVGNAVLIGADAPPQLFSQPQGFSVSISVKMPMRLKDLHCTRRGWDGADAFAGDLLGEGAAACSFESIWHPWMVNCETPT
jgi:hypothetical protein